MTLINLLILYFATLTTLSY